MQRITSVILAQVLITSAAYAKLPTPEADRIVQAIYKVEGGSKARVPYGILSVRVSSKEEARKICTNTVQRNHDRWLKAGEPGDYLDFLADRYCPKSEDPKGNRNWKKNIRAFLSR
jgi:hypothetical protein